MMMSRCHAGLKVSLSSTASPFSARAFASTRRMFSGRPVYVVGNGMVPFTKPGTSGMDYPEMVKKAATEALTSARVPFDQVEQAAAGYVYGDSCTGTRAVYEIGFSGIPVWNVNSNCSTGSSALMQVQLLVSSGVIDCGLAVGFEKMKMGSLSFANDDREGPVDHLMKAMFKLRGSVKEKAPPAPWLFGAAGRYHMETFGTKPEHFGKIAEKNHRHSQHNPYAQFRDVYTLDEIMGSKQIYDPLTMLQCSPTSDGAAAALLVSEDFVKRHGLEDQAVEIKGQAMTTDAKTTFENPLNCVGADMTRRASEQVYQQSGLTPDDVDVIELHDCFSTNELITYEGLGLCKPGEGKDLVDEGATSYGGRWVVNPSGGLISKGHPLGATGLAQCYELCAQLRGTAGDRQVKGARVALQHNLGLGGAAVVTMYAK